MQRIFALSALVLGLVITLSGWAAIGYISAARRLEHTLELQEEASGWLAAVLDVQANERGYVATGSDSFLTLYEQGRADERAKAAKFTALLAEDRAQARNVETVDRDACLALDAFGKIVALVKAGHRDEAVALLVSGENLRNVSVFQEDLRRVHEEQGRAFAARFGPAAAMGSASLMSALLLAVASAALLVVAWRAHQARNLARAALRGREDALAVVAHDLRNPLSTIVLAAKQVESLSDDPASRTRTIRAARTAMNAAGRMSRLVADLLDTARLESGHPLPMDVETLDVVEMIRRSVEEHGELANKRKLAMTTELPREPVYAACDEERMQQVLSNLIGNAIKFTGEGGAILISARRAEREVIISVGDTGTGIPAEHLPHLFTPYWRADTERKRGAGLGLFIVRAIAQAHGGRVWVESVEGCGSTFYFALPLEDSQPSEGER